MDDDDSFVTRRDLREELVHFKTGFKAELKAELKAERDVERAFDRNEIRGEIADAMNYVVERLGAQMVAMEHRLTHQIANAHRVAAEEARREIGVLDDRYRDLPGRVTELERGLDEHRRDATAHASSRRPPRRG